MTKAGFGRRNLAPSFDDLVLSFPQAFGDHPVPFDQVARRRDAWSVRHYRRNRVNRFGFKGRQQFLEPHHGLPALGFTPGEVAVVRSDLVARPLQIVDALAFFEQLSVGLLGRQRGRDALEPVRSGAPLTFGKLCRLLGFPPPLLGIGGKPRCLGRRRPQLAGTLQLLEARGARA